MPRPAPLTLRKVQARGDLAFWLPDAVEGVAFTGRTGGHSSGPYLSLNLGRRTGDAIDNVERNRRVVSEALGISSDWNLVFQMHSAHVVEASRPMREQAPEADAIVGDSDGPPMAVVTADCLPIALRGSSFRGVVHAGWRGLSGGVIDESLSMAAEDGSTVQAWIGPSIGPCHYTVGPEVVEAFCARYPEAPDFVRWSHGNRHFDLRAAARWVLRRWGVWVAEEDPPCTFCDPSFFSHRREGRTGRQAVVVW